MGGDTHRAYTRSSHPPHFPLDPTCTFTRNDLMASTQKKGKNPSPLLMATIRRDKVVDLCGEWKVSLASAASATTTTTAASVLREDRLPCVGVVPGDLFTDLIMGGALPCDPGQGQQEEQLLDQSADDIESATKISLVCEGLDTLAQVEINEVVVGKSCNMFTRKVFDIPKHLLLSAPAAVNGHLGCHIRITFSSSSEYCNNAARETESQGQAECTSGRRDVTLDGGPAFPTCGIYRPIYLVLQSGPRIEYVRAMQIDCAPPIITEPFYCEMPVSVQISSPTKFPSMDLSVSVTSKESNHSICTWHETKSIPSPGSCCFDLILQMHLSADDIWWPRGMGKQTLLKLEVTLVHEGTLISQVSQHIGARHIQFLFNRNSEAPGAINFVVNGIPLFIKGADWIPMDLFPGRITKEKELLALKAAAQVNMNMIRVWGGGVYETDSFYSLCDQLGLLVWQDFMFSCSCYPASDDFLQNVSEEVQHQLCRLCSHPCIAIWCGNNECEEGMPFDMGWKLFYKTDYERLFRDTIWPLVQRYDPSRTYWRSSPCRGTLDGPFDDKAGCLDVGDSHVWAVWHGSIDYYRYLTLKPRFCNEFGFQSLPFTILDGCVSTYGLEAAEVVQRQRSANGNKKMRNAITSMFGVIKPGSPKKVFEMEIFHTQLYQAFAMKTAVEHMRRLTGYCTGILYWQLNDIWVGPSWSSLEYDCRFKVSHYWAQNFYAPILTSCTYRDNIVDFWLSYDGNNQLSGTFEASVVQTKDCSRFLSLSRPAVVNPMSSSSILQLTLPPLPEDSVIVFSFRVDSPKSTTAVPHFYPSSGATWSSNILFLKSLKDYQLSDPKLSPVVNAETHTVHLETATFTPFVWLCVPGVTVPFTANGFTLVPPHSGVASVDIGLTEPQDCLSGLSLLTLFDTVP
ncbi:glycoside hydrolase family 2 protein [Pelomyxa schiedti]|nr:glycoside hydrolase family 2 protein [Pelomyxa schiedti]